MDFQRCMILVLLHLWSGAYPPGDSQPISLCCSCLIVCHNSSSGVALSCVCHREARVCV